MTDIRKASNKIRNDFRFGVKLGFIGGQAPMGPYWVRQGWLEGDMFRNVFNAEGMAVRMQRVYHYKITAKEYVI